MYFFYYISWYLYIDTPLAKIALFARLQEIIGLGYPPA